MQNGNRNNRFLLLYGSQTGQAEAISEEFRDRARVLGLNPDIQCMIDVDKSFNLERETLAVIVISTTGDGEAPDNARKLFRRLKKRTLTKDYLNNLSYCLLALGDSNYLNFCNCGKEFDKRLRELGAKPFQETSYADDAIGLEVAADPWIDRTLQYLIHYYNLESRGLFGEKASMDMNDCDATLIHSRQLEGLELNVPSLPESYISINYHADSCLNLMSVPLQNNHKFPSSASEIFPVSVRAAKRLTTSSLVKEYIEMSFELPEALVNYQPGDAFGFVPENDTTEVEMILDILGVLSKCDIHCYLTSESSDRNVPNHLPQNATLRILFTRCCDIRCPPKKVLLRVMAEHATDPKEKRRLLELCSRQGSSEFLKLIRSNKLSILDLLKAFPSCCQTPVSVFLENLPRLQARYYSVTNSPLQSSSYFSVVFSVVNFTVEENGEMRTGVCTGYLKKAAKFLLDQSNMDNIISKMSDLKTEDAGTLYAFKRETSSFVLPKDSTIPLVMVGPGAGVAPFLGFLRHRQEMKKQSQGNFGETWLYFGCRHKEHDFLFEKELHSLESEGVLNHLRVSLSRDSDSQSRYVQENISKDIDTLVNLIESMNASVYVCGDAKNMSKDVANAFVCGYEKIKGVTRKEAEQWHSDLLKCKRYVQDIWL